MVLAQKVAKERGHNFIGGAHFALALIESDRQSNAGLFDRLRVSTDDLRTALEREADLEAGEQHAEDPPSGSPPFTPPFKKALEMSLREALKLSQTWIGPGHMLLGLLSAAASGVLVERLPLDEARVAVAEWEAAQPLSEQSTGEEQNETVGKGFSQVLKAAMTTDDKPIGSHHLLLGMFEAGDTLARKVLESLGVTEDKVRSAIDSIGTAGTVDAPPPQQAEITVAGRTVIVNADDLRNALGEATGKLADLAEKLREVLDPNDEGTAN